MRTREKRKGNGCGVVNGNGNKMHHICKARILDHPVKSGVMDMCETVITQPVILYINENSKHQNTSVTFRSNRLEKAFVI